jgi:tRNA(fMet)-specific endonuclease VapC
MKLCIDTNAYTALKIGSNEVGELVENAEVVFVPAIVLGELYAGFFQGKHFERNVSDLRSFLNVPGVEELPITASVAERYGILVTALRKSGNPIPTNDIWIAAAALETGSRLLSYDKHFAVVPGLLVTAP